MMNTTVIRALTIRIVLAAAAVAVVCGTAMAADWPQWGGTASRNMISQEKDLPETFQAGDGKAAPADGGEPRGKNIKWTAKLGSQTYGSPVVAGGRVFVGSTKNGGGWLLCFDEQTGKRLWELAIPKLSQSVVPHSDGFGLCSTAAVQGERVYVVSNRGEVLCLDVRGMANGNDGPFKQEGQYMAGTDRSGRNKPPLTVKPTDGDILWRYDMVGELKVQPHNASSSSPLIHGDFVYVGTANGTDGSHKRVPNPLAPSLIALDKRTGRLVAADREKIGTRVFMGQWSSPSVCEVNGSALIIFGAGDGFCYAFRPVTARRRGKVVPLRRVWSVDCNPAEYRFRGGKRIPYKHKSGPSGVIATPVAYRGRVYVAIGQDPSHGKGSGMLTCISAAKGRKIWTYKKIGRSISTVAIADGLVYAPEDFGTIHCLDARTGRPYWTHPTKARIVSSAFVADGKVYVGSSNGLWVLAAGRSKKVINRIQLDSPVEATPCAANGTLFVASRKRLYAASTSAGF